jgi:hypothetical protein
MQSNIFHDPNKNKLNESTYKIEENKEKVKEEKVKEEKKQDIRPKALIKTKTSAKLDWKTQNTELLFKGDKDKNE